MEQYVTLVDYDPQTAKRKQTRYSRLRGQPRQPPAASRQSIKQLTTSPIHSTLDDKSEPFLEFQSKHDLYLNLTDAGGGKRPSRRVAVERKTGRPDPFPSPPAPNRRQSASHHPAAATPNGKPKADLKGKGKAFAEVKGETEEGQAGAGLAKAGSTKKQQPTAAAASRRKSLQPSATPELEPAPAPSPSPSTASRAASPAPSNGKGTAKRQQPGASSSLKVDTLASKGRRYKDEDEPTPSPPSSPDGTSKNKRLKLSQPVVDGPLTNPVGYWHVEHPDRYTHPLQMPLEAKHGNSLEQLMRSYLSIDQGEGPIEAFDTDAIDSHDADVLNQVAQLQVGGYTLPNPDKTSSVQPKRPRAHWDYLVDHAVHFSRLVHDERKSHIVAARRTGRAILQHFERIKTKDLKAAKDEERERKLLAKNLAKEVRKKWKMAANVVKAQRKQRHKEEQERIGKEQLNLMLDKSTTILHAQNVERTREEYDSDDDQGSTEVEEDDEEEEEDEEDEDEDEDEEDEEQEGEEDDSEGVAALMTDSPGPPTDDDDGLSPPPRPRRPTRRHSTLSISATTADMPAVESDEEAGVKLEEGDVVFEDADDAARAEEDDALDAEMDADGDDDSDDGAVNEEDDELTPDQLYAKYYGPRPGEDVVAAEKNEAEEDDGMDIDEAATVALTTNGVNGHRKSASPPSHSNGAHAVSDSPAPTAALSRGAWRAARAAAASATAPPPVAADEAEAEVMSEFGSGDEDQAREDEDEKLEAEMEADGQDDSDDGGVDEEDDNLTPEQLYAKYYGPRDEDVETNTSAQINLRAKAEEAEEGQEEEEEEDEEEGEEYDEGSEMDVEDEAGAVSSPRPNGTDRVSLKPPFLLRATLRPYQQAGLEWLASLYTNGVNGILADEMGLGKTIQTISLLAHLACDRGQWGPHLVVVPTSVMLNWEMEFKKFLPGFKIMTYYGNVKERREKRKGWNTPNAFHVCVTSYQLILADQFVFRRKAWHYLILDEAHHIKNFRSQRWQTLLGFNARHRLLLTGTPLQNNLMELWSLLYFLMPQGLIQDGQSSFAGHADFQSWFSNPMEKAIEGGEVMDEETKQTVAKLHTILRPYLLRRLKAEVETQMPGKTESIIYCRLSKRQRFLYDDFMSRAQTRETLGSGHFLSIINCLMQLRKVCNHPDLFEVRPIVTSFSMPTSVASQYEPKELLVRRRLLAEDPIGKMDWSTLTLIKPDHEANASSIAGRSVVQLDAASSLSSLYSAPIEFDPAAEPPRDTSTLAGWRRHREWSTHNTAVGRLSRMAAINTRRCRQAAPFFGHELLHMLTAPARENALLPVDVARDPRGRLERSDILPLLVKSREQRALEADELVSKFGFVTPKVKAPAMARHALAGVSEPQLAAIEQAAPVALLQRASTRLSIAFPDASLLQYDCGKLQKLDELLRECKAGGHRVLIFTQMTKVLDILEMFLSFHGHRYLRLDGSTKIEQRQVITERFNSNDKILCFISSTRSGGLGINLQGADTVIFYDSDWNPALDRQCQDRAHRIGQTREVRIWRFVTEHSIEENMLKKANQKRKLDEMVISDGDFTTDYLQKLDWRDYLDDRQLEDLGVDDGPDGEQGAGEGGAAGAGAGQSAAEIRMAMAAAEDEEDAAAARAAEGELQADADDFKEVGGVVASGAGEGADGEGEEEEEEDPLKGTVDGYMIRFVEDNWDLFD